MLRLSVIAPLLRAGSWTLVRIGNQGRQSGSTSFCRDGCPGSPSVVARWIAALSSSHDGSNRLSNLSQLSLSTVHLPHLPPRDRHHLLASLRNGQDNTKLILGRAGEITSLVSQRDHNSPHNIADPETLIDLYFVNLGGANVLLADDCRKGFAEDKCAGGAQSENVQGGLARVCACDAAEDYVAYRGESGCV